MELNALLATPALLPSLPRAVALLMSELAHEEPNLRRVNQLFGTDPALAARLLEKANSDAFAGPRTVAGISEALALLGTADLRELVSTAPLGTASRSVPADNTSRPGSCENTCSAVGLRSLFRLQTKRMRCMGDA